MMNNDNDWVEDVRRWYFNSSRPPATSSDMTRRSPEAETAALGYEAAHPALQAPSWQTPPTSSFGTLR